MHIFPERFEVCNYLFKTRIETPEQSVYQYVELLSLLLTLNIALVFLLLTLNR